MWHRIAARLTRSVSEAKSTVTATEFLRWIAFFEKEIEEHDKVELLLAAICLKLDVLIHIETNDPKKPRKFDRTMEDYLPTAKKDKDLPKNVAYKVETKEEDPTPLDRPTRVEDDKEAYRRMMESKSFWLLTTGAVDPNGVRTRPLPKKV